MTTFTTKVDGVNKVMASHINEVQNAILALEANNPRERLNANRIYYVRLDGHDENTGLTNTADGAFATIQKAVDTVAGLDVNGQTVTIQVADGTHTMPVVLRNVVGTTTSAQLILQGNLATPTNCVIATTGTAIHAPGISAVWTVQGFKVTTTGSGSGVAATYSAVLTLGVMEFGSCATYHIQCEYNSRIRLAAGYTISGGASRHWSAICGGLIHGYNFVVTLTGTPAFGTAFGYCSIHGQIYMSVVSTSGSATGPRYACSYNSVLVTGITLPGDSAGTTSTGGQVA